MESEFINRAKDNKIMRCTTIEIPVFRQELILCYGTDEDFEDYVSKVLRKDLTVANGVTGKSLDIETHIGRKLLLFINEEYVKNFNYQYYVTVTHEVYHIVADVLHFAGITYDKTNDEPGAHLTGYLNQQIAEVLGIEFED